MSLYIDIKKKKGDFTLQIKCESAGGIMGILGASGSGKSTLFRCIAGVEKPDSGVIILNGKTLFDSEKKINLKPQERYVGYLFQDFALFPNMTVKQNIMCGAVREQDVNRRQQLVDDVMDQMNLATLADRNVCGLSGGEKQRTALARILVSKPEIILLDEPFSALDEFLKDKLQTWMKNQLKKFGKDTIIVSHDRDEIYKLCDNLMIVDNGRSIGYGSIKQLFKNPRTVAAAVLTGCKNIVAASKSGDYEVVVPSWGDVCFKTKDKVLDGLVAIGLRAHAFSPDISENSYPIRLVEDVEEPFEWSRLFAYESQKDEELVWWRIPKGNPVGDCDRLGIKGEDVMLLYEEEISV